MLLYNLLGERGSGVLLLAMTAWIGGAIHSLSAIPGQGIIIAMLSILAVLSTLLGTDFVLGCPVMNRLMRRKG